MRGAVPPQWFRLRSRIAAPGTRRRLMKDCSWWKNRAAKPLRSEHRNGRRRLFRALSNRLLCLQATAVHFPAQPNILFILVDDLRYPTVFPTRTPAITRLGDFLQRLILARAKDDFRSPSRFGYNERQGSMVRSPLFAVPTTPSEWLCPGSYTLRSVPLKATGTRTTAAAPRFAGGT